MRSAPTIALIVAGGKGSRFSASTPKQYSPWQGSPILRHTIMAFLQCPAIDHVQVVIAPEDRPLYEQAVAGLNLLPPTIGGVTRQISVRQGLQALAAYQPGKVLIHDAARPFVSSALIERIITALDSTQAVIPALPLHDTIKQAAHGLITATLDRQTLFSAQTPQGFHYSQILELHQRFQAHAFTDDAALCEQAGLEVTLVEGERHNRKITTTKDIPMRYETRIGSGFDAHRFKPATSPNPHVMLGGIAVPYEQVLEAHSDGDVVLHALVDALLGAIGKGDIGQHFPPSDPQWKDADSSQFVAHACRLVQEAGGRIINADLTLIGEAPRVGPYRTQMAQTVAALLGIEQFRVNIKATTTEKMGFTGRKEGLAAQAVVGIEFAVE